MQVEQAKLTVNDHTLTLPVIIPEPKSIRAFAQLLHERGATWSGTFEGWPAAYRPEDRMRRPAYSRMNFIPAEFFVGISEIWQVGITWEDGLDTAPVELEIAGTWAKVGGQRTRSVTYW